MSAAIRALKSALLSCFRILLFPTHRDRAVGAWIPTRRDRALVVIPTIGQRHSAEGVSRLFFLRALLKLRGRDQSAVARVGVVGACLHRVEQPEVGRGCDYDFCFG